VTFAPPCTGRLRIYSWYDKVWKTSYSVRCDKKCICSAGFFKNLFDLDCLEDTSDEIKCTVSIYSFWSPLVAAVWLLVLHVGFSLSTM